MRLSALQGLIFNPFMEKITTAQAGEWIPFPHYND